MGGERMMNGRKAEKMDPEEVAKKRKQIEEIINRCGRLSDEDLAEVFGGKGGANDEAQYVVCGSEGTIE